MVIRRIIFGLFFLAAATLGFFSLRGDAVPSPVSRVGTQASAPLALAVDWGDGTSEAWSDIPFSETTAFHLLEEQLKFSAVPLVYTPSTSMGVFVRSIGGRTNGDDGRYWQYWVNDTFPLVAADRYALEPGDRVRWGFAREQNQK